LPDRHPNGDFFVCDIFDAAPKDDLASMEHPIFSLSTRPDRRILSYDHNGTWREVTPSVKGRATIHDKDILIYCISQLMAALNAGRRGAQLHLTAHDLLVATNRETSGDAYRRLREAFERLAGTRITTNIATGGVEVTTGFGLIESWQIVRTRRAGGWSRSRSRSRTGSIARCWRNRC
jgi:plasmid replication initiation protein